MRSHRLAAAALLALLASADAAASSSSSSSSASSSSSSSSNSSSGADSCSSLNYVDGCWYPVTCDVCLSRAGCSVDTLTGACVSTASVADRASVGGERYYQAGSATYCDTSDELCVDYFSGAKSGVCTGWDGCIASYECTAISSRPSMCEAAFGGFTKSVLVVVCVLGLLVPYIISIRSRAGIGGIAAYLCSAAYARYTERRARQRREQQEAQRHARAEADPTGLHKTLKLENWHKQRDAEKRGLGPVELDNCYIQMPNEDFRETVVTDTDSLPTWDSGSLRDSSHSRGSVLDVVATPVQTRAGDEDGTVEAANAAAAGGRRS